MTTTWAQLLHFYQPPTQTHDVLRRVVHESYRPLMRLLINNPQARLAININAVLTQMLVEHGYGDVVENLRTLGEREQVEFVGSGRYHPILPLIPEAERARSIRENASVNRDLLGEAWRPQGFFPPEMCFSPEITSSIAGQDHRWFVVSGVACPTEWPTDIVHRVRAGRGSIQVLFRDDVRSNRISFRNTTAENFLEDIAGIGEGKPAYVLTAMDAETFGHHAHGWDQEFLARAYDLVAARAGAANSVCVARPSELVARFPAGPVVAPRASSWSTSEQDIVEGNPFPLWQTPGNAIHRLQWAYVDHALSLIAAAREHAHGKDARKFAAMAEERLQPALHSCQFWWASRRPMWDVAMIHRGLLLLSEAILYAGTALAAGTAPQPVKQQAEWRLAAANDIRWSIERELLKPDHA